MRSIYPYLVRSKYQIYHFRIIVPEALRATIGLREIRRSLRTRDRREAIARSTSMLTEARELFQQAQTAREGRAHEVGTGSVDRPQLALNVPVVRPPAMPTLSVVFEQYATQQALEGVSVKTLADKRSMVEMLVWMFGDLPIDQVDRACVRRFRDNALKLPPGFNRYRHLPLKKVIANAERTISVTTYNNYVKYLGTVFTYAVHEGYCAVNPFAGQKICQRTKANAERARYQPEDLDRIFTSSLYTEPYDGARWHYWLPLLGLYTGARLNELCQLYLDDFVQIDGIDCIYIRASNPDQKIKNLASERVIPIHSKLIELGLLSYVERLRRTEHQRLFPELPHSVRNGYGHKASR